MSIDDFANHLGLSRRGVAAWSSRGQARLRWDVQRKLDDALLAAPAPVKERLAQLRDGAPAPTPQQAASALATAETATPATPPAGGPASRSPAIAALSELLIPPPQARAAQPPPLIRLELQVARVRMSFQAARYRSVVTELPALAQALAGARADPQGRFPLRIRRLASAVHQITASLLLKLGDLPLAMLAAERSASEARASGDPLVIAASARCLVQALQHSGYAEPALACTRSAAQELIQATGLDGPRPLSAHGALLLSGAVAAAQAADRPEAARLLAGAARAARTLRTDGNFGWTAFGPTNVSLHRLGILLRLAEPAAALRVSAAIDPSKILHAERLATYHVDSARAWHAAGQPEAALSALKKAYAVAPDEVRMRPQTHQLAAELAQVARGPAKARAARFAEQVLTP